MAKNSGQNTGVKYPDGNTDNPLGTYHQPIDVPVDAGMGYPQTDIGKDGVTSYGRWSPDIKQKQYGEMRGKGAATKGTKFLKS
jgi:hypothetical protein